jgi:hypothetical protein
MKIGYLFVTLCSLMLAGCGSFNAASQMAAADPSSPPVPAREAQGGVTAAPSNRVTQNDLAAPQDPPARVVREPKPRPGADRRPSTFVQENPDLFSDKLTDRPWPKAGSDEWKEQEAKDARREREMKERIKICRDC